MQKTARKRFLSGTKPKEYVKLPRIFEVGAKKTEAQKQLEPDTFQRCPYWTWWQDKVTKERHKRSCGRCRHCRDFKHERIVGQAVGQAQTSSVIMGITLTYADVIAEDVIEHYEDHVERAEWAWSELHDPEWVECNQTQLDNLIRVVNAGHRPFLYDDQSLYDRSILQKTGPVTPSGGVRLDKTHIEKFVKRLRKAGYRFVKISCGEYGGKNGRAHWHLLLMFEWDPVTKSLVMDAIKNGQETRNIGLETDWRSLAPPFVSGLRGEAFKQAVKDPETLVVTYPTQGRKAPKVRNEAWKFWEYGIVECQVVKTPEFNRPEHIEGAIRYPLKYLSKDAWRDSRKYQNVEFHDLPEHIRQQTRFGPWLTTEQIKERFDEGVAANVEKSLFKGHRKTGDHRKWVLGNPYVKELEARLLEEYSSEEDVPLERQLMKGVYNYKCVGGLGADFFYCYGWHTAANGLEKRVLTGQEYNFRGYQVGANYRKKQRESSFMTLAGEGGGVRSFLNSDGHLLTMGQKRFTYAMGNTSFLKFWDGYNAQKASENQTQTVGPEDIVITLETSKARALASSSGSFGYHLWNKSSRKARRHFEDATAVLPDAKLVGLWPVEWRKNMELSSRNYKWRLKGLERQMAVIRADEKKHGRAMPEMVAELAGRVENCVEFVYETDSSRRAHGYEPLTRDEKAELWSAICEYRLVVKRYRDNSRFPHLYDPPPPKLDERE